MSSVETLKEYEDKLKALGLNEKQLEELSATIKVLGDAVFDDFYKDFYE